MSSKKEILLHCCCAPCASASLEKLLQERFDVTLFYSNSNIFPEEEYKKRLESLQVLARIYAVPLKIDTYDHPAWLSCIHGLEKEPEKGKRCQLCFGYSFQRSQMMADELKISAFTTTLTISPHKFSPLIFSIGKNFPKFQPFDFKKKNGFQRSITLSRELNLYRQHYCGCEFSIRP